MFKFIYKYIQKLDCVNKYENGRLWDHPNTWDARSHIKWGCFIALTTALTGFIHPLFLLSYIIGGIWYAPLTEFVLQYHKEKDKPLWDVLAQVVERGCAFIFLLPIPVIVLVLTLIFNLRIL